MQLVSDIFASGLSTIQAEVIGGFGTYEYSLDGIEWQTSPVFTNLENNIYVVYARDMNGCGEKNSDPIVVHKILKDLDLFISQIDADFATKCTSFHKQFLQHRISLEN